AALDRYGRRAAFRPTPVGLLAGVTTAALGPRTRLRSTTARAQITPAWGRLVALGRALLDDPDVRAGVCLRLCPSLLVGNDEICWLALGNDEVTVASAALDPMLATLLELLGAGARGWPEVRDGLSGMHVDREVGEDVGDVDDWLMVLVDQGLLCTDLVPPLVGEPPAAFLQSRLSALTAHLRARTDAEAAADDVAAVQDVLGEALRAGDAGDLDAARTALAGLPGAAVDSADVPDLHGVLHLETAQPAVVDRRAIERAVALAPLLFGLQEALTPPAAERALDPSLLARLSDLAEVFGEGAFDFAALATGGYGQSLVESDEPEVPARPDDDESAGLVRFLIERMLALAEQGGDELVLDPEALAALLPAVATPPSFELVFTPASPRPRSAAGTDWLLGHHAPAGASWGRFAHGLPALQDALAELAAIEGARGDQSQVLDVEHAAGKALADLSAHPPVRAAALALTGWPAGPAVVPASLEIVIDEAAPLSCDLRRRDGTPLAPSPLHRVRSTTLPAGLHRLLAGWSFARQHAPWSFSWGPLAGLDHLPRVVLDGFVIAPRSFRVPAREVLAKRSAFAQWRRELRRRGHLRHVQVGEGDELLPIDLDAVSAAADLARHAGQRGFEIWPPLDRTVDEGGRRIELVAAVVDEEGTPVTRTRQARRVPLPAETAARDTWLTFRLYGARAQQSAVLFEVVAPLITAARNAGDLAGWFFLPYADPGTGRDHLRVRLAPTGNKARQRLQKQMARVAREAQRQGRLVALETTDYFPEVARYGGPRALLAAEAIFEASSDAALALLEAEQTGDAPGDRITALVRASDALARGFGLDLAARRALAERRREAFARLQPEDDAVLRAEYRERQRELIAALLVDLDLDLTPARPRKRGPKVATDVVTKALRALSAATARAAKALTAGDRSALGDALPALLHVQAVRFCGADAAAEQLAHVLWSRALESLAARIGRGSPAP
ncbi:MAG TPA: thiopeptide-type bacteriocin biosynthesis protein, partial [Polyangia bacterium]